MYPEYYIVVKEEMFVIDEEGNEIRLEPGEVYEIRTLYGGQEVVVVDDIDYDIIQNDIDTLITVYLEILENVGIKTPPTIPLKKNLFNANIYSIVEQLLVIH